MPTPSSISSRTVRAIVFDFDGVLVDSESLQARAWVDALRDRGLPEQPVPVARIAGRLDVDIARELASDDSAGLLAAKTRLYDAAVAAGGEATIEASLQLVRQLAGRVPMAICSNAIRARIDEYVAEHALREAFAAIVSVADGFAPKPAPDGYREAVRRLGVRPEAAIALEDSETGLLAAHAAGLIVVQRRYPGVPHSAFAQYAIDDATELLAIFSTLSERV